MPTDLLERPKTNEEEADNAPEQAKPPPKGPGNVGKRAKADTKGAVKGAAKGATEEGVKGAIKGGEKGAQAGAELGSAMPVVGTAAGALVGGAIGAAAGGAAGAAKGAGTGAVKGARDADRQYRASQNKQNAKPGGLGNKIPGVGNLKDVRNLRKGNSAQKVKTLGKEVLKKYRRKAIIAFLSSPIVWIPLAVIGGVLLIVLLIAGVTSKKPTDTNTNTGKQADPLQLTKTGPTTAKINDSLPYTITVSYAGSADDVTITDPLPQGTSYVSSTPAASVSGTTLTWNAKALGLPLANPVAITINLVLKATQDNLTIANIASATVVGGASSAGYKPAVKDNCGGKDKLLTNPLGNYGDPDCSFNKDDLYTYLKTNDAQYADIWFLQVVPKECSYNPNAWAPPIGVQGTLDVGGAWGCFQMGSSFPPGIPPDPTNPASYGKNDNTFTKTDHMVLDRGDVNWQLQAHNAIMYNRIRLHCSFTYWGSITNLWNKYHC